MVSWVCISSCVDFSIFVTVTLQNVCGGGLLCVRDSSSGSDGEEIYGSSSGKGCVSSRDDKVALATVATGAGVMSAVVACITPPEGC